MNYKVLLLAFLHIFSVTLGQDCRVTGEFCEDEKMCCGGCCYQNYCISTNLDCGRLDSLCRRKYCPEYAQCALFHPCRGCDIQVYCKLMSNVQPKESLSLRSEDFSFNDAKVVKNWNIYLIIIIVFLHSILLY